MCGRYVLKRKDLEALMEQLGVKDPRDFVSRYNIAPTTMIPAVRLNQTTAAREAVALSWGLVPFWSKDASGGARHANARSEGIASKPAFREALKHRRCVVPASGFYEWQTLGKLKFPWYFEMSDGSPFLFAGIWESWRSADGVELQTCSLITTTPNAVIRPLHDRMPVILRHAAIDAWLDAAATESANLQPLLAPLPDDALKATPVSPRMNSVKFDGPECLEPAPVPELPKAEASPQLSLGLE